MSLVKGKNIDVSKITFSEPRVLDNGAKLVYVNYNGGRFSVQTPWMTMPWKMGVFEDPNNSNYKKYSIDMSFKDMDDIPDMKGFHDKLKEVEDKIIDGGLKNCVSWLKKDPSKTNRDVIDAVFNPIVKVSKDKETGMPDGKWPPNMKLKVPRRDGQWECKVFKSDGEMYKINADEDAVDCEEIFVKNTRVRAIIQCVGLWIASGNYMCQWKLTKAEVDVPVSYSNEDFLSDSDGEGDDDDTNNTFIEDSDEETDVGNGAVDKDDNDGDNGEDNGDDDDVDVEVKSEKKAPKVTPKKSSGKKSADKKTVKRVVKRKEKNED